MAEISKDKIRQLLFQSISSKYDISEAKFNRVWAQVDKTGIIDKVIEKKRKKAVSGYSTMDLDKLESLVSDDLVKNNELALEMIKHPNFNRELVNSIYNGLGVSVNMGKEGTYGEGIVLKRKLNLQQFYTNSAVSDLIVKLLNVSQFGRVFDPTCGSGRLFFKMPNQTMVHGIEIESDAYRIAKALYPQGQIIQDTTMHHIYEDVFDYVVGNPPFTLYWEDEMRIFKNTGYSNKIVSEMAVIESGVRSLKNGGYLSLVMPSNVWITKFIDQKNFIEYLQDIVDPICKIDLPTKTHEGTEWPVSLYIFRKTRSWKYGWDHRNESRIPQWQFTDRLNSFNTENIDNIVNEFKEKQIYKDAERYSIGIQNQAAYPLEVVEFKKFSTEEYLKSSIDIKSDDKVILDAIVEEIESFILPPLNIKPNGLHADLKVKAIRSHYPFKWSPSRKEYVDIFKQELTNLDQFIDERKKFDELPLIKNLHEYDCAIELGDGFKDAIEKRKEWVKFQDTPFEIWVDETDDFDWKKLYADQSISIEYPEIWDDWVQKLKKLEQDPKYVTFLPFLNRKDNWIKYLFEYQKIDVIRLATKASAIHAGQMGLGKTRSSIATAILKGYDHNLIVCKQKLVKTWIEEFEGLGLPTPYLIEYNDDLQDMEKHKWCIAPLEALRAKKDRPRPKYKKKRSNPKNDINYDYDYLSPVDVENETIEFLESLDFSENEINEIILDDVTVPFSKNPGKSEGAESKEAQKIQALKTMGLFADNLSGKFDYMIMDEAHDLSNPLTKQTQAVWRINPKQLLFLTGTPIKNRVKGLLSLLVIGWGEETTAQPYSKESFLEHFMQKKKITYEQMDSHGYIQSKTKEIEIPQINNPDDLRTLMAGKWLRRTKYEPDVSNNIKFPKPFINFVEIEPSEQEKVYAKQWYDELMRLKAEVMVAKKRLAAIRDRGDTDPELEAELKIKSAICVIMISKLRAVALCPQKNWLKSKTVTTDEEGEEDLSTMEKTINIPNPYKGGITPRQKHILSELVGRVKKGEQCYTICDFPDFNKLYLKKWLVDKNVKAEVIDGSVSQKKRNKIIKDFRDKKIDVILATIKTFDVGINIPAASYCAIMMPSWNWSDMEQAYNRMIRPQSKGERTVDIFILKDTIETYVNQLVQMKRYNMNYVLDYGERPPESEWQSWTDAVNAMFIDMKRGDFNV